MTLRIALPLAGALALLLTAAAAAADPAAGGKYWTYFGTYTGGKGGSKGIYRAEFDSATGKLSEPVVAAEVGSPSFLAIAPNGKTLYAVGEGDGGKDGGGVYAFRIDPNTGGLSKLDKSTSGGAGPCHVAVDPAAQLLVVANYGGGSWKVFRLKPDGGFEGTSTFSQLSGGGPNKQRQEKPHAHCAAFDKTGKVFFVVDLGTDQVHPNKYEFVKGPDGSSERKLEVLPTIKMPAGSGPRHIDIAAGNDWAFVCGELDCTANVVKLDFTTNEHKVVQSVSTLPSGKAGKGDSTAEVRVHPSGKFVYVSNRGHNSIAAFGWDGAKLTPLGHATDGIKTPRNFNLDPTGKWMLVANQDGDDVVVFAVGADGLPTPTGTKAAVPKPVCVKFLAKP